MKLYGNETSSATARVCIALALKGLAVETQSIGIFGEGAENRQTDYLADRLPGGQSAGSGAGPDCR